MSSGQPLDLVQEALDNLVNQFARPLDFLRELVQNSLDAGSSRVDVAIGWNSDPTDPDHGVIEIEIADHGEGMDEAIIDHQLTRMFSSTKEDDLTKIGKFGIGFTSVFAIQPDAVLLRTGRHGESWELLFHADRTFDKTRCTEPIEGTKITLYKTIPAASLAEMVQECRWTLQYWCEHSEVPIHFRDRTEAQDAPAALHSDPFAAFAEPRSAMSDGEVLTSPMSLDSDLQLTHRHEGVQVAVGYCDRPRYGFYNHGLTLVHTRSPDVLGHHADRVGHLGIKVKSRHLEHTLTRDNVLQDAHWDDAMTQIIDASMQLRKLLLERIDGARGSRPELLRLLSLLAIEASAHPFTPSTQVHQKVHLPLIDGGTISLHEVDRQESSSGEILVGCRSESLTQSLRAAGIRVLEDAPAVHAVLRHLPRESKLPDLRQERRLRQADEVYVLPELLELEQMDRDSLGLLRQAEDILRAQKGAGFQLRLGQLGQGIQAPGRLTLQGPADGGLFRRDKGPSRNWLPWAAQPCTLIDRRHASWQAYRSLWSQAPLLAAVGLSQLILFEDGSSSPGDYRKLYEHVAGGHA